MQLKRQFGLLISPACVLFFGSCVAPHAFGGRCHAGCRVFGVMPHSGRACFLYVACERISQHSLHSVGLRSLASCYCSSVAICVE